MIHLLDRSAWTWETSGSGGFSIDVVAATGGVLKLFDPAHRETVFYYGGLGMGISTPGVKVPKLGSAIAKQLVGRMLNGSVAPTFLWNTGVIFRGWGVGTRELTRADFTGACILADLGVSTPIRGLVGSVFLVGIDPLSLLMSMSPPLMVAEIAMGRGAALAPKAAIFAAGDSRGLVAGGNAYLGYLR